MECLFLTKLRLTIGSPFYRWPSSFWPPSFCKGIYRTGSLYHAFTTKKIVSCDRTVAAVLSNCSCLHIFWKLAAVLVNRRRLLLKPISLTFRSLFPEFPRNFSYLRSSIFVLPCSISTSKSFVQIHFNLKLLRWDFSSASACCN
jgi:hypothetical protein